MQINGIIYMEGKKMKLVWNAMTDSTQTPIKTIEIPNWLLTDLNDYKVNHACLFGRYHALDLTDLKYELSIIRINCSDLEEGLRRKIKSFTHDLEAFIEWCEQRRYNVVAVTTEDKEFEIQLNPDCRLDEDGNPLGPWIGDEDTFSEITKLIEKADKEGNPLL